MGAWISAPMLHPPGIIIEPDRGRSVSGRGRPDTEALPWAGSMRIRRRGAPAAAAPPMKRKGMRMPIYMELNEKCGESHAISDVFCEKQRKFLVEYPQPLIVGISAAGLVAFLLVGYLGYNRLLDCGAGVGTCWQHEVFLKPWPLYVWFCALMVTLQVSILRNPRLRAQLVATLVVTLVSAVAMYWLYFYGPLQQIITDIIHFKVGFLRTLFADQWFYTILNFLLIALFFVDTGIRWARRAQGKKPGGAMTASGDETADANDPRVEELAAGDLVAGMVLFGLMALVFTFSFIHGAAALTQLPQDPNLPIRANIATVPDVVPLLRGVALSQIDRLLALICLPLGFVVLAVTATLWGLSAVRAVVNLDPRPVGEAQSTENSVTAQVALVLFNALRAALDRYVRFILLRILSSLRNVAWLILIFIACFGLAALSDLIQQYLHTSPRPVAVLIGAALAVGVAILGVTLSASLLLATRRVATNSLLLLYWIGFVLGLTFWLFSATMVGIDWLGQVAGIVPPALSTDIGAQCRDGYLRNLWLPQSEACNQPFAASYLTFLSALFLVGLLVWLFARQALAAARTGARGTSSSSGSGTTSER